MPTVAVVNFSGALTRHLNGSMNSGLAKYAQSHSYDPYSKPGSLTWQEQPIRIDSTGVSSITGLVVAGKTRVESGLTYMYAVDHNGQLYKITVNSSTNVNVDSPSVIGKITSNSPTFKQGGSMDFFGSTQAIYIGHDVGVTKVAFDGSGEAFIGSTSSITSAVPRPLEQFAGKLYAGNGTNIMEIAAGGTVNSYAKLSPALPVNTQIRDLDLTPDGNYLEIVSTEAPLGDITSTSPDTGEIPHGSSYVFKWNGTDTGITALTTFNGYTMTSNKIFGSRTYRFAYDLVGAGVYEGNEKVVTPLYARSPLPNAASGNANILGWVVPESLGGFLKASLFTYGRFDQEFRSTEWRRLILAAAQGTETDVIRTPFGTLVTNLSFGATSNGYGLGVYGAAKAYYSTLENATATPATAVYKFYKSYPIPTGTGTPILGVYETQTELFSEKIAIREVRIYTEPLVANNGFKIDLIGSDGNVITGSSQTFTVGTNATAGDDIERYSPNINQTYALGLRITNTGTANMTFHKVEFDYEVVKS